MKAILALTRRLPLPSLMTLGFVAVTAAIGLAGWLVSLGLQKKLDQLARERQESCDLLERTGEMHSGYTTLQKQLAEARRFIDEARNRVPQNPDETAFLSQLSQLAATAGVEFSDFRPGGIADRVEAKEIELQIRGTGKYAGICRLLAGLHDLPRVVRVSQLAIDAPSDPGGNCAVSLQLYLLFGFNSPNQSGQMKPP